MIPSPTLNGEPYTGERVHPEPSPPLVVQKADPTTAIRYAGWLAFFFAVLMPVGLVCYGCAAVVRTVWEAVKMGWRTHEMGEE